MAPDRCSEACPHPASLKSLGHLRARHSCSNQPTPSRLFDSHRTLITRLGPTVSSAMTGIQRYPLWSPDGLRIAYWAAHSAELRIFSLESLSEQTVAATIVRWLGYRDKSRFS